MKDSSTHIDKTWLSATGPVPIRMTNDYLFRALLQRSNTALKGLICSLLHLSYEEISTVEIVNPIELGKSIASKDFFLDVIVALNSQMIIHLEMQVINQYNWPERSLSYLCRTFDSLCAGESYLNVKPVVQIGLLDYTLFPEYPEFYAAYEFRNSKNHYLYSDKLRLCIIDLNRIDLATNEDKLHRIDYWASLFKATTWEEIKMLAKENSSISDAASTIYHLSQEEMIRLQCEAREDYYRTQNDVQYLLDKWKTSSAKLRCENKALASEIDALIAEKERLLAIMAEHGIQPE